MPNYKLVGLLMLCLITSLYVYHNNGAIDKVEIKNIKGILSENPYEGTHGGDMPIKFLVLKLQGFNNEFYINNCSYKRTNLEKTLSLVKGDSIRLGVIENTNYKNKINIYELYSTRLGSLLNVEDYNSCSGVRWKVIYRIAIIIAFVLVVKLGLQLVRLLKRRED